MALVIGILCGPENARSQGTETQELNLKKGKNFVSLRVQPEDATLSTIFQGHLDQIHRVVDERGRVYMPNDGIEQFVTWDANESYKVYTTDSFDIEVVGAPISLTTAAVPLEKRGNMIPFLPAGPQAVDEALASISGTLLRVEDETGNTYEPDNSSPTLDSLHAGQGYKLYVDQADTLVYPIHAATLADALSLEGIEVGQHIKIGGRNELGDGGGGIFITTSSACETDGATCFVFNEDRASVSGETVSASGDAVVSNSDLVWGTVECRYGNDPEDVVKDLRLAGHHRLATGSSGQPWIDHAAGAFKGGGWAPFDNFDQELGDGSGTMDVSYDHATSDRRLERKGVSNSVSLAWYGAPKADPNNPESAGPYLSWALNRAAELYQNSAYNWAYVDVPGQYYVRNTQMMFSGVKVRGTGDLNADGFTRGTLKLLPGEALYHLHVDNQGADGWYSIVEDSNRKRAHSHYGDRRRFLFSNSNYPEKFGWESLLVDGNLPNNRGPFDNQSNYSHPNNSIERYLQDSGDWQLFYAADRYNDKQPIILDDVHIRNVGGSGVGIGSKDDVGPDFQTPGEMIIDTAYRNHLWYGLTTQGWVENVTLKGTYWGGNPVSGSATGPNRFRNITVKDLYKNPDYSFNSIFGDRDGTATMEDVVIDLRGSTHGNVKFNFFNTDGQNTTLDTWTVHGFYEGDTDASILNFYNKRSKGAADEGPNVVKNIEVYDEGVPIRLFNEGFGHRHDVIFENMDFKEGQNPSGESKFAGLNFSADVTVDKPQAARVDMNNVNFYVPIDRLGPGQRGSTSTIRPRDIYWRNSHINLVKNKITFRNIIDDNKWRNFSLFFDNVHFESLPNGGFLGDFVPPEYRVRIRNSTGDFNGTTLHSEDSGTYISDAGDEENSFVRFQTELMSNPFETEATVTSGTPSVTSIEVTDANGDPLSSKFVEPYLTVNLDQSIGTDNTIEIDWAARVTPLDDYRTTGLFVAREVPDQSYSTGNGPWMISLKGVASSQESRERVVYTASSGDASVVTANMQSDDYTLELTEQGTGTATITVTGEIPGVGTTQTTFEVTVE